MYLRFARLSLKTKNRVKSCGVAVNNPGLLGNAIKKFLIPSVMNPSDAHNSKRGPTQPTDENESQYSLGQIPEWSEMDGERDIFIDIHIVGKNGNHNHWQNHSFGQLTEGTHSFCH